MLCWLNSESQISKLRSQITLNFYLYFADANQVLHVTLIYAIVQLTSLMAQKEPALSELLIGRTKHLTVAGYITLPSGFLKE